MITDAEKAERNRQKQSRRNAKADDIARSAGWEGWSAFKTAVINGVVKIPNKPES